MDSKRLPESSNDLNVQTMEQFSIVFLKVKHSLKTNATPSSNIIKKTDDQFIVDCVDGSRQFRRQTESGYIGAGQMLELKYVSTNICNGYNANTGTFAAPVSVFSLADGTFSFIPKLLHYKK